MTTNLFETIRRQFTTMRHLYAGSIATRLRTGGVAADVYYDNRHDVCTWRNAPQGVRLVRMHVSTQGVSIEFTGSGATPERVTIAVPYTIDAVATVVEGLLSATTPVPAAATTMCCGQPIPDTALKPWRFDGDPVHEGKVYHCPRCNENTLVDVIEVTDDGDGADTGNPTCHNRPMRQDTPRVWFYPGGPVHVEVVYRCTVCHNCDHVEIVDRVEADRLAARWGITVPPITAGGTQ